MLEKLAEQASPTAKPGYQPKDIRWALDFDDDGRFLGIVPLGQGKSGRRFDNCPNFSQPEMVGGDRKAHFLADTLDRVIGFGKEDDEDAKQRRQYFVKMLHEGAVSLPELERVARALEDESVLQKCRTLLAEHKAKPSDKATLRIGECFPLESEAWHPWWDEFRARLRQEQPSDKPRMVCFVTGELVEPARIHEAKIKGLNRVGGQPSGDVLVGFDKEAFTSYGLEQSLNAAVSEENATRYCAGLNRLIQETGRVLAGTMVVHWFTGKQPEQKDNPFHWLDEAFSEEQVEMAAQTRAREMLEAIRNGRRPDLANNLYYAMTLSGQAGRVMVRDWMEGQFEQLVENVYTWFEDLSIVHRNGGRQALDPKFYAVLRGTVRALDDLAAPFVARLWRVAVRGEPIPQCALARAVIRAQAGVLQDEPANHARMGLIKAYHLRKNRLKGGVDMSQALQPYLNENHPSPAYQCGRLMAVLAGLQRSALGDVGAGVVQRYYAAASTTPALVLGRLLRTAQFHLGKLEGGLSYWYEEKIGEISGRLGDGIPRTLTLEEQSLFALGYYQQLADMRTKKVVKEEETPEEAENNV